MMRVLKDHYTLDANQGALSRRFSNDMDTTLGLLALSPDDEGIRVVDWSSTQPTPRRRAGAT